MAFLQTFVNNSYRTLQYSGQALVFFALGILCLIVALDIGCPV